MPNIPYQLDINAVRAENPSLKEWIKSNGELMDSLVLQGAEMLLVFDELKYVDIVEFIYGGEIAASIGIHRHMLIEALENNEKNWVEREEYLQAAKDRAFSIR